MTFRNCRFPVQGSSGGYIPPTLAKSIARLILRLMEEHIPRLLGVLMGGLMPLLMDEPMLRLMGQAM